VTNAWCNFEMLMLRPALAGILALSLLPIVSAGPNANAFSEQTSRPMMKNMGGDINFGEVINLSSESNLNAAIARDCENGGSTCRYFNFIFSNFLTGLLVIPLTMLLFNFVFCCGRCCCRKKGVNKQGCTGGRYPTREYNKFEGFACIALLACFMIILFAFSVAGAAAFDELKADLDLMLDGIGDVGETPGEFGDQISDQMGVMKVEIRDQLQPLNDVFTAVTNLKTSVGTMRTKFTALDTSLKSLASLIEGCKPGSLSCTSATRVTNWNQCGASGYTAGTSGSPAVPAALTSSGSTSVAPTCKNVASGSIDFCQCAPTVQAILTAVQTSSSAIPSDSDLDGLDVPLPLDELDTTIDDAASDFKKPLDDLQETMPITRRDTDPVKDQISAAAISGITFIAYSPAWYVIIAIIIAIVLGAQCGPMKGNVRANECGDCCWWVAYVMLTLWLMIFVWPLFGTFTIPAVILEDLCELLPEPGGSSKEFTDILVAGNADPDLINLSEGLFEECLLPQPPNKGYIWAAIPGQNISKQFMRDQVSEFSTGNSINATDITKNLRVLEYTKEYINIRTTISALSASDYTSFGLLASYQTSLSYTAGLGAIAQPGIPPSARRASASPPL